MSRIVLDARRIVKSFGTNAVLKGVDLQVYAGDRYFLFGPNGAGKTTLVKVLVGLLKPESGTVHLFGETLADEGSEALRARVGVLSHEPYIYGELSALENLVFYGGLYNVGDPEGRSRELLKEVGLYSRAHDRANTFSRGMRQRLGLARALLHDPDLVLLDEPYTGLDMGASETLDALVRQRSDEGKAFLAISHDLSGGTRMATRAGILDEGRLVLEADVTGWNDFAERYRSIMRGGA